jgi:hypothetical protein
LLQQGLIANYATLARLGHVSRARVTQIMNLTVLVDEECVRLSLENVKKNHVEELVRIEHEDLFQVDLSKANVVMLYLLPHLNVKLIPQPPEAWVPPGRFEGVAVRRHSGSEAVATVQERSPGRGAFAAHPYRAGPLRRL